MLAFVSAAFTSASPAFSLKALKVAITSSLVTELPSDQMASSVSLHWILEISLISQYAKSHSKISVSEL